MSFVATAVVLAGAGWLVFSRKTSRVMRKSTWLAIAEEFDFDVIPSTGHAGLIVSGVEKFGDSVSFIEGWVDDDVFVHMDNAGPLPGEPTSVVMLRTVYIASYEPLDRPFRIARRSRWTPERVAVLPGQEEIVIEVETAPQLPMVLSARRLATATMIFDRWPDAVITHDVVAIGTPFIDNDAARAIATIRALVDATRQFRDDLRPSQIA